MDAANWTVSLVWSWRGKRVEVGTEVSIAGTRGRYRFVKHVRTSSGAEWVDVIGPGDAGRWRSFRPERIRGVHRSRGHTRSSHRGRRR